MSEQHACVYMYTCVCTRMRTRIGIIYFSSSLLVPLYLACAQPSANRRLKKRAKSTRRIKRQPREGRRHRSAKKEDRQEREPRDFRLFASIKFSCRFVGMGYTRVQLYHFVHDGPLSAVGSGFTRVYIELSSPRSRVQYISLSVSYIARCAVLYDVRQFERLERAVLIF